MDKKRRKKTSLSNTISNEPKYRSLHAIIQLISKKQHCGLYTKKFQFLPEYGEGYLEYHRFEGLQVSIFDAMLHQDFNISRKQTVDALELSFLIDGEQIIKIDGNKDDFIYENQESYLVYIPNVSGSVKYHKNKPLKEVKIRMTQDFIKKYELDTSYEIKTKYALRQFKNSFIKPLCTKTQEILAEILIDNRQGLLKRLFLESKVLELLSLQLDTKPKNNTDVSNTDHHIKKLYNVQYIINTDLTTQHSVYDLARKVGMNDFMLKKEFKRVFGTTIFEYTLNLRMTKAKKLLKYTKKPIYEISELVGYKNSTHFTAAFKKIEGTTPKNYRKEVAEAL